MERLNCAPASNVSFRIKADNSQFNAFIDECLRAHPDLKESTVEHYEQMMLRSELPTDREILQGRLG